MTLLPLQSFVVVDVFMLVLMLIMSGNNVILMICVLLVIVTILSELVNVSLNAIIIENYVGEGTIDTTYKGDEILI